MTDDIVIKRCDRCGKYFELKVWQDDIEIHGVSPRCSERVWRLCPDCLYKLIEFIDGPIKRDPYKLCSTELRTWREAEHETQG